MIVVLKLQVLLSTAARINVGGDRRYWRRCEMRSLILTVINPPMSPTSVSTPQSPSGWTLH